MKDVFIKAEGGNKSLGFDIGTIFETKPVTGDVGIEIECEGNKFPKRAYKGNESVDSGYIPKIWNYHKDGSLRGKDNAEYVLFHPIPFADVPEAVGSLFNMFKEYGTKLDVSNRTSVHVHLNVQRWHLDRLCTFMAMYFALEEILTQWCGEHRVGNLFCLRAKDAPGIVTKLKKFLQSNGDHAIHDGMHYAGFNAHALGKFGSVEIRSLRGCQEPDVIIDWVDILRKMYSKSADYTDPRQLMEDFSGNGPLAFIEKIMEDKTGTLLNGVSMTTTEVNEAIYEGIYMAQDLTYCRDWSLYTKVDTAKDPFGRLDKPSVKGAKAVFDEFYPNAPAPAAPLPYEPAPAHPYTIKKLKTLSQNPFAEPVYPAVPDNPHTPGGGSWLSYNKKIFLQKKAAIQQIAYPSPSSQPPTSAASYEDFVMWGPNED